MNDPYLMRWSMLLLVLATITLIINILAPLSIVMEDAPILLTKGTEVWQTTLYTLSKIDAAVVVIITLIPQMAWIIGVAQIVRLAKNYRKGKIFDHQNTILFIKLGYSIVVMGILGIFVFPILNTYLFCREISPWLGDMNLLTFIQPDLLMAGILFIILGKIMRRGVELQETDQLTV